MFLFLLSLIPSVILFAILYYFLYTLPSYSFNSSSSSFDTRHINGQHFKEKTVWITGASSGIGQALALTLAQRSPGIRLILSSRNASALETVAEDCRKLAEAAAAAAVVTKQQQQKSKQLEKEKEKEAKQPENGSTTEVADQPQSLSRSNSIDGNRQTSPIQILVLPLDLENIADDFELAKLTVQKAIDHFGSIDVLVNNGGLSMRGAAVDTVLNVDKTLLAVNYLGAVSLTKAVLPHMIARGAGHLVAVSSVQGKLPIAFRSAYAASKHALHGFFHSLRYEVAENGIHVTVACPGYVATNLSLNAMDSRGGKYGMMDQTTQQGYSPSYVADMILSAIRLRWSEIVIADKQARMGIMLHSLAPALLTPIMMKRARKEKLSLLASKNAQKTATNSNNADAHDGSNQDVQTTSAQVTSSSSTSTLSPSYPSSPTSAAVNASSASSLSSASLPSTHSASTSTKVNQPSTTFIPASRNYSVSARNSIIGPIKITHHIPHLSEYDSSCTDSSEYDSEDSYSSDSSSVRERKGRT